MEKELTREVVEKLVGWLDSAGNFVLDQAPDIVQQMLLMRLWECSLGIIFSAVLLGILMTVYMRVATSDRIKGADGFDLISGYALFLAVFSIPLFMLFLEILKIIEVFVAPKVYILEKLSGLM